MGRLPRQDKGNDSAEKISQRSQIPSVSRQSACTAFRQSLTKKPHQPAPARVVRAGCRRRNRRACSGFRDRQPGSYRAKSRAPWGQEKTAWRGKRTGIAMISSSVRGRASRPTSNRSRRFSSRFQSASRSRASVRLFVWGHRQDLRPGRAGLGGKVELSAAACRPVRAAHRRSARRAGAVVYDHDSQLAQQRIGDHGA